MKPAKTLTPLGNHERRCIALDAAIQISGLFEVVLAHAYESGVDLWLEENQLRFRAPKGAVSSQQLEQLRTRKQPHRMC